LAISSIGNGRTERNDSQEGSQASLVPLFAAQPGIAADRFARKIVRFLKAISARSRQLNAKPLGGYQTYRCLVLQRSSQVLWHKNTVLFGLNESSVV